VGVGDIGAVHCGTQYSWDASCVVDGRGEVRERDRGILIGPRFCEIKVSRELCWYWVGISDSEMGWTRGCCFFGKNAVRTDRMRGDRVGLRDISVVQGGALGTGDTTSCDDDR
jgi:hypothetical protein